MAPTVRTVATYSTHQEYSIDIFGDALRVTVTPDFYVISQWIDDVVVNNSGPYYPHPLVVGVGVQWTPPFSYRSNPPQNNYHADPSPGDYNSDTCRGSYNSDPPADTLQLCVGNRCLIIQLRHCEQVPNKLRSFLANQQTTYVGVWNHQDAGKLERSRHQVEIGKLHDIREYVNDSRGRSMSGRSFEEIVEGCMGYRGLRLDREISMSDWSVYNLDLDQIFQASVDVHVCYRLGVWARLWEY